MLNCAVSGDILKKDFRLMTFGRCKVFQRDIKGRGFELPHQGVSSVGERGHRLTERRPPFLGGEQALAVKDANPRISRIDKTRALILPWGRITRSSRRCVAAQMR
jgi:hypothetical protein